MLSASDESLPETAVEKDLDVSLRRDLLYESYPATHYGCRDATSEVGTFNRDVLPHLPVARTARILDVGCGQGDLVRAVLEAGFSDVAGIDISEEQVRLARSKGLSSVKVADLQTFLRERPSSVDCIIAIDVLEHLTKSELIKSLRLIHGALAPGGVVIARMPNATSPFAGNYGCGDFTHEVALTPRSFQQVALGVGFRDVTAYPCAPYVHGIVSGVRAALWYVTAAVMRLILAIETGKTDHIVTQAFVTVVRP